jgi:group I intron endonuclease
MKIGYIYKLTSPSNREYIGQTVSLEKRFYKYKNLLCKNQPKIYNSLVKYGYKNHKIEILGEYEIDKLNDMEIFWKEISLNENGNNINKVLFCRLCDSKGRRSPLTQEHKDKISKSNKGKTSPTKGTKNSSQTLEKKSIAMKIHYEQNGHWKKSSLKQNILDLFNLGFKQCEIVKQLKCDQGYASNVINKNK